MVEIAQKNGQKPTTNQEEFIEIWESLSHNQRRFVLAMQECGTKVEAAEVVGVRVETTYHWPKTVNRAIELLMENARDAAISVMRDALLKAALVKVKALDSEDERIAQQAASEIIDRNIGKAQAHIDVKTDGQPVKTYVTISPGDWAAMQEDDDG